MNCAGAAGGEGSYGLVAPAVARNRAGTSPAQCVEPGRWNHQPSGLPLLESDDLAGMPVKSALAGYRCGLSNIVRCQSLCASPVISTLTCLIWVYSSNEYMLMSLPKPGRLVAAVWHPGDDRDVIVDPHATCLDLPGGTLVAYDIAGPSGRCQPIGRVVCQRDRLVVGVERQRNQYWPNTSSWTISLSWRAR